MWEVGRFFIVIVYVDYLFVFSQEAMKVICKNIEIKGDLN